MRNLIPSACLKDLQKFVQIEQSDSIPTSKKTNWIRYQQLVVASCGTLTHIPS